MGGKSQRALIVEARRAALGAQTSRRAAARERERRVVDLATTVIAALEERAFVVQEAERRAGVALRELVEVEGLGVREAVAACGGRLDEREATRLRRLAEAAQPEVSSGGPEAAGVTGPSDPTGPGAVVAGPSGPVP